MLTLLPVYSTVDVPPTVEAKRAGIEGFAVAVSRIGTMLDQTFLDPNWAQVGIALTDVTDESHPIPLAARGPATVEPFALDATVPTESTVIDVDGRKWRVDVMPTEVAVESGGRGYVPYLLVFGMLLIGLLEALLLLITGTERQARREAEVSGYQASHDSLTDLLNRRAFLRDLEMVQHRTRADGTCDVLMFLDLDRFKAVNDQGGHETGDRMLVAVAHSLRSALRSRDIIARMGGDEFAVILNGVPRTQIETIGHGLIEAVEGVRVEGRGRSFSVDVSIGATVIADRDRDDLDGCLRRADAACYLAKRDHGGSIIVADAPGGGVEE
jgi:diguanylate cyclase (GGDEF)-like protein